MYLRKLRIKYQGKDERALLKEHPLFVTFEKIEAIMKKVRSSEVSVRPKSVKQLCEVLKDYCQEEMNKEKNKRSKINEDSLKLL